METSGDHTDKPHRIKRYFLFFCLFGQNVYLPENCPKIRFLSYISSIFSLFLIVLCQFRLGATKFKSIESEHTFILFALWVFNMIPSVVAAIESFRMPKKTQYLMEIFGNVTRFVEMRSLMKIDWKKFQNQMSLRFKVIFFCCIVSIFFRLIFRSPFYGRRSELLCIVLWFYRAATLLHVIFYIDLLNFLFSLVTSVVETQRKVLREKIFPEPDEVTKIVNVLKCHHFQVWECYRVINQIFGRIFIAVTLDSVCTITNTGYWAFYLWIQGQNVFILFRKYFLHLIHFFYVSNFYCYFLSDAKRIKVI